MFYFAILPSPSHTSSATLCPNSSRVSNMEKLNQPSFLYLKSSISHIVVVLIPSYRSSILWNYADGREIIKRALCMPISSMAPSTPLFLSSVHFYFTSLLEMLLFSPHPHCVNPRITNSSFSTLHSLVKPYLLPFLFTPYPLCDLCTPML